MNDDEPIVLGGVCESCHRQPGERHTPTCEWWLGYVDEWNRVFGPRFYTAEQWERIEAIVRKRKPLNIPPLPLECD